MKSLTRPRVCAAIICEDKILMVKHEHGGRSYWTLPGGGVENKEDHEQAVIREVYEETHLEAKVVQFLFEEPYSDGTTYCYLAQIDGNGKIWPGICRNEEHNFINIQSCLYDGTKS